MEIILKNGREYPRNTKFILEEDTLRVVYKLRIPLEVTPFITNQDKVKVFKKGKTESHWLENEVKIKPVTDSNIEVAYTYVKSKTMSQIREAKLKYADRQYKESEVKLTSPVNQLSMF